MSRVRIMLTVATAVAGALPRASAFAPGAPFGALRARLAARSSVPARARAPRAGGARMVATEPAGVKESPQPSPDFKFSMEDITSVCKRRGFIFPSSEIYQGTPAPRARGRLLAPHEGKRDAQGQKTERCLQGPACVFSALASTQSHRARSAAALLCMP